MSSFYLGPWLVEVPLNRMRCSGQLVQLEPKIMQVLLCLAAAPGQLVKKEDLIRSVWPDTFVTDDVLTRSISELRKVFGDDPRQPQFIETIPKSGYRLVMPVVHSQETPAARISWGALLTKKDIETQAASDKNRPFRLAKLITSALFLALLVATVSWYRLRPVHVLIDKDVIVVADFDNHTGEPVFDNTLRTALAIDLEQSPFLSVLPDLRIDQILKQMERGPGDRMTPEVGREVCLRTSSKALLAGSITSIGSHYALQLKATNCQTGETLAATAAEAESRENVLRALGQAATGLRSKLGESLASVQKYDKPLEEATTSSLEALQAFSEGDRTYRQKGAADAIPFFKRAVELDPEFGSAYTYLGTIYGNLGEERLHRENLTKGFKLRSRLTAPEQYIASGLYYHEVTGELEQARHYFELMVQEHPNDFYGRLNLADVHFELGQYEQAATEYRAVVRVQPDNFLGYEHLGVSYTVLGRLDEAQAALNEAFSHKLDSPGLHRAMYDLAFQRNDAEAMQRQLTWAMGKPVDESWALLQESTTQSYYGRLGKARECSRKAIASALNHGARIAASIIQADVAIVEAEVGNAARARQMARAALALSKDQSTRFPSAITLAAAGDSGGAQEQIDSLSKARPLDTYLQNDLLPAIRAQTELNHGHAQRALGRLEAVNPYSLSVDIPPMYAIYVRGQAYLALGNGAAAAAEFQNIIDHRSLVGNDVTGALAHLYVGRSRALEARSLQGAAAEDARAKARTAYQDFLTLWKDADPDIPILRQAKAERARLQ